MMMIENLPFSRWIEIDLDKLAANLQAVSSVVDTPIIAVVKNDAYGFGAGEVAQALVQCGVKMLAVTTLEEALEIREYGVSAPLLVFEPPVDEQSAEYFAAYSLIATVDGVAAVNALAVREVECHIKLNTGMNRFGVNVAELPDLLAEIKRHPNLRLGGMYSHLATAPEPDEAFAKRQIAAFKQAQEQVLAEGFAGICCHMANSAGAFKFPEARFDAVRLGSVLYGQLGLAREFGVNTFDPFCAKARIAAVRELHKGESVGYAREFVAKSDMRVAVVPYGYGDGFGVQPAARPSTVKSSVQTAARSLGKLALGRADRYVYHDGSPLTVLGRVAMQNMLVDISNLPLGVGDVLDVPIRRTATSAKIPRVYYRGGEIVAVRSISRTMQEKLCSKE